MAKKTEKEKRADTRKKCNQCTREPIWPRLITQSAMAQQPNNHFALFRFVMFCFLEGVKYIMKTKIPTFVE